MLIGCFVIVLRSRRLPRPFGPRNDSDFRSSGITIQQSDKHQFKIFPKDGLTSKFTIWEVINKGNYVLRNRPGERIIPRVDGSKALKSYVVVPTICTNQSANLQHPCLFDAKYSKEYATMTDPGAVALAVNGKGIVQDTADTLVNDTTKIAKDGLKVMASAEETSGTYFIGFSCANHSANMANEVLKALNGENSKFVLEGYEEGAIVNTARQLMEAVQRLPKEISQSGIYNTTMLDYLHSIRASILYRH